MIEKGRQQQQQEYKPFIPPVSEFTSNDRLV